jgi:DNA-binding winged helix-turn-helix (wHTH) protein/tetratricopeptide (TPR) repeat protein/TolB-like protein
VTELQPESYRFGSFLLEVRERRLLAGGIAVPLKPRSFDVLVCLLARAGHLVTKEELFATVWPDTVVEESNLAKNVWLIRRALAEVDGETPFVETVTRIGYRFVAPVERVDPPAAAAPPGAEVPSRGEAGPPRGEAGAPWAEPEPPRGVAVAPRGEAVLPWAEPEPPREGAALPRETAAPPHRWRAAVAVAAAACLVAVAIVWSAVSGSRRPGPAPGSPVAPSAPAPAAALPSRPAVAVLGFENLTHRSESAWVATALAEMMSADLAAGEKLRLVPDAEAARFARTLPPEVGALARDALAAARWQLATDYVVKGFYAITPGPEGEQMRLDVILQSAASGETLCTVSRTGASHRLFLLVDETAHLLRTRLGLEGAAVQSLAAAAAALPAGEAATRLYAEGLEKLRQYDALGARARLTQAVAIEPSFPLAHAALSQALAALGYDQLAVDEARQALALAHQLTREQQLEIAAALAEAQKDWAAATNTDRALLAFFPDNLEYGLNLVRTEVAGGKAEEALTVIAALRQRSPAASRDPRIDLAEAGASAALSDWRDELAAAERAIVVGRARGLPLLLGEALLAAGSAAGNLGQVAAADAAWSEAARIFHGLGDINREADALVGIANFKGGRGDYDGAIAGYRQALATYQSTGNRKGAAHAWSDLANLNWMQGNVEECLRSAGQGLALSREIDDRRGIVWGLSATGNALADQGDIDKALAMQQEALAISRAIGDREYTAFCVGSIADTQLAAGKLDDAERGYREALQLSQALHDPSGVARHAEDLGLVALAEDRLDEADRLLASALDSRQRLNDQDSVAQSRLDLAQLRIEQGRPAEALVMARQSFQAFALARESGNSALALSFAAQAEIKLHQDGAAAADGARAREALQANRQTAPNLYVMLAQARAAAAAGQLDAAQALAGAAQARAEKARALGLVLEARLVQGEIEFRRRPGAARAPLQALARDARAARYLLIARKAEGLAAAAGAGAPPTAT